MPQNSVSQIPVGLGRGRGQELVAEVLADNAPMLKVFEPSGLALTAKHEGSVVHVSLRYAEPAEPDAEPERSLTSRT